MTDPNPNPDSSSPNGLEHPGVVDLLRFDPVHYEVLMVMREVRPWTNPELQLFQLQEKLNAYMSFILDGEMLDSYPQFKGRKVRVRLECVEPPPEQAFDFLQHVYEQAALQGIAFDVDVQPAACGCGENASSCRSGEGIGEKS